MSVNVIQKVEESVERKEHTPLVAPIGSEMLMWRVDWKIYSKPVRVINLGDGNIKVVGSCMITQKLDDPRESYHETYKAALLRYLTNAQRDVNSAKKKLANAQNRLKSANAKWMSYLASPNSESSHRPSNKENS